jgi:hypothetical protein
LVHSKHDELNPLSVEKATPGATKARNDGLFLLVLGAILFAVLGFFLEPRSVVAMADFNQVFYGARCLLTGCDLYSIDQLQRLYLAESDGSQSQKLRLINNVKLSPYPPAAYVLVTPFAALPWRVAHRLWMSLTCAAFVLAAFLMWDLGFRPAPLACGLLIFLFLIGQELLIEVGNPAGLAIALCLIAVWCFLRKKLEFAGVLCLAVSLAVKPHDSGLVWLYFLAAGGIFRKRAIQTLLCTVALSLLAILWVRQTSPDWMTELSHNLTFASMRGGFNDPGPAGVEPQLHGAIVISLQSAISLFRDEASFYNRLSYLICALLLIIWIIIGVRSRFSPSLAPLALASISVLAILPIYHRQHDAGLLLLTVPACTLLWSKGRWIGKCAVAITAAAAILLNNLSLQILAIASAPIRAAASGFYGQILALLLTRPAPIALLALVTFYLRAYSIEARKMQVPSRRSSKSLAREHGPQESGG